MKDSGQVSVAIWKNRREETTGSRTAVAIRDTIVSREYLLPGHTAAGNRNESFVFVDITGNSCALCHGTVNDRASRTVATKSCMPCAKCASRSNEFVCAYIRGAKFDPFVRCVLLNPSGP